MAKIELSGDVWEGTLEMSGDFDELRMCEDATEKDPAAVVFSEGTVLKVFIEAHSFRIELEREGTARCTITKAAAASYLDENSDVAVIEGKIEWAVVGAMVRPK